MTIVTAQPGDLAGILRTGNGLTAIRLAPGNHGPTDLRGIRPSNRVQILGQPGAQIGPTILRGCAGLLFRDLLFEGGKAMAPGQLGLAQTQGDCEDIGFDRCTFQTVADVAGWAPKDWVDQPFDMGLFARGVRSVNVTNSQFRHLRNGMSLNAAGSYARNNRLSAIGNDFIRLSADGLEVSKNVLRDGRHSPAEPEHADAIHLYPAPNGGMFRNIVIADNDIEGGDLGDYLQGISLFDGRYANVKVIRNRLAVRAWNAIALYGVDGVLIDGNTVSHCGGKEVPWIEVRASKDGRPSTGVVVRNNEVPTLRLPAGAISQANRTSMGLAL